MFTTQPSSVSQHLDSLSVEPLDLVHQPIPSKHDISSPWPKKQLEIESPKTKQVYVHPLVKSPSLSPKSLEMCTESLGSETGSDMISDLDAFSYHAFENPSPCRINPAKRQEVREKTKRVCDFPPPLTSIGGSAGVHIQAHREDGRLVIKAFSFSCCRNYLRAERGNGRLRLSMLRDSEEEEGVEAIDTNEDEKVLCGDESDDVAEFNGRCYWGEDNSRDDDEGGRIECKINGGDWSGVGRCNGDRIIGVADQSRGCRVAIS